MKLPMSWVLFFCVQVLLVQAGSDDDFLNSDDSEKPKIEELRGLLGERLSQPWQKEDNFLLRFLREKDMDVPSAQEMILAMFRWREQNAIDGIDKEENPNFAAFEAKVKGFIEGCDVGGRPILSARAEDGDISEELAAGKEADLKRYALKMVEEAATMLWTMNKEGQKVSQATVLMDLKGFNLLKHACPKCIPFYVDMLKTLQENYPGFIHRIVAINAPNYAMPIWDTYKHSASPKLRDTMKIIGSKRSEWEKFLRGEIPATECTAEYGGTKPDHLDLLVLRKSGKTFKCGAPISEYSG